jgi:hypothetical protein
MTKTDYRLMGLLYHECICSTHIAKIKTTDNYFDFVLRVPCTTPTQSDIFKYDYFSKNALADFQANLSNQNEFMQNLNSFFDQMSKEQKNSFNNKLYTIVSSVTDYSNYGERQKEFGRNKMIPYEPTERSRLLSYYSAKKDNYNLSYNVYLLIYLAVYKRLPPNFFFGFNYESSLREFNEEVTCKYGVTSKPGIRAIINLAERNNKDGNKSPNIFALYEYADMLYYGNENGPKKDINAAFKIYKKISTTIDSYDQSPCHPLAQWTLAYIYFNYHQPKSELKNCDTIPEIENLSRLDQLSMAIKYAKYAYDLVANPAAANILGKISLLTDKDVPGIEAVKQESELKDAIDYFKYAASKNYVYAYGSLTSIYLDKIFEANTLNEQKEQLDNYLKTLKLQADQHEPWAANKLGLFYLNGKIENKKYDRTLPPFEEYIHPHWAHLYFYQAISQFSDQNSGWAYANLIIYFPKDYIADETLSKLKEHLAELKRINNVAAIEFVRENFMQTYSRFEESNEFKEALKTLQ